MGRKYIGQVDNNNFVYPNYEMAEYDVEIVHDINNNCITGTVINFSAVTFSSTSITFTYSGSYNYNGSQPFNTITTLSGTSANYLSVHCQVPNNTYMNTWRVVDTRSINPPAIPVSGSWVGDTFTITPAMFGLASFTNGTYFFDFRFFGEKCVYKICTSLSLSVVTPTPTPTITTTPTVTPTPGLSSTPTPTVTSTPGTSPSPTPTITTTPTVTPSNSGITSFGGCGYGSTTAGACIDAGINNRTLYSNCDNVSIGVGCIIYSDAGGTTPLTGYTNVYLALVSWDVNSSTAAITALSSEQC